MARPTRDVALSPRQRLVWDALLDALQIDADDLDAANTDDGAARTAPIEVLDCGGGSGSFAVPLAGVGAQVTVVDISVDALATLHRRAEESGVADRINPVQGDVEALGEAVPSGAFTLVLAHGILESVDALDTAFAAIAAAVRPGGLLSIVVSNPVAAVLSRALTGDLDGAVDELRALDRGALVGPQTVSRLCAATGLTIERTHGVGVFSEMVPGAALDRPGAAAALAELEAATATRAPFADIASRVHTLARKPG